VRLFSILLLLSSVFSLSSAQEKAGGPVSEKAQKTYNEGLAYLEKHMTDVALECFKKADKQDGGHCLDCEKQMIKYGIELHDWKIAETGSVEIVALAQGDADLARAHYRLGVVFYQEGLNKRKEDLFIRAHDEFSKALSSFR
jgi:hypothetical protein